MIKFILCTLLNKHNLQQCDDKDLSHYKFCTRCGIVDFMANRHDRKIIIKQIKKDFKK